jgi:hypothetical protein
MPMPGLQGDYEGSCVACQTGTDTGLAFEGEAEWLIAGLTVLGLSEHEASLMVSEHLGGSAGEVPDGVHSMGVRVCAACVAKSPASFPAPALVGGALPTIRPPG